ncbi:hypothetical protein EH165_09440 [Nakamurella antarctica]|uniref:Uncharacterized protein n=1 Tax=Nakamurella antarctica TaxID=1902245 RepID=A0A3G8ZME9_9ACTN|nr:hypothetical protein [Nakamurella antarctica]AZI58328.1 hypothetical protein EH165_09440 [Nakamurella antarctica]
MTTAEPDHEFEELEPDSSIPPRPEEEVADAALATAADQEAATVNDNYEGPPAQGYGAPDSQ